MEPIKCFLLEPTNHGEHWLHRSNSYTDGHGHKIPEKCCPLTGYGHNAAVLVGTVGMHQDDKGLWDNDNEEGQPPHDDPRWPAVCECGYRFSDEDGYSASYSPLYRHPETGETFNLRDAPVGAMWYADWMVLDRSPEQQAADIAAGGRFIGPDRHCVIVMLPGDWEWCVDGPATGGGHWTRTGDVPNITASPSVWADAPEGWHGFLRDGYLVKA